MRIQNIQKYNQSNYEKKQSFTSKIVNNGASSKMEAAARKYINNNDVNVDCLINRIKNDGNPYNIMVRSLKNIFPDKSVYSLETQIGWEKRSHLVPDDGPEGAYNIYKSLSDSKSEIYNELLNSSYFNQKA